MGDTTKVTRYGVLPWEKRREMFGLDSPDQIEWRNWQPGTEYVKNLSLKNVSTNTIKIKYKQTASKAFSMDFPEPFKLRPGMSHALKVVFRPLRMQQYSDHIEIFINDTSSFIVLVEAHTPATHVQVPPTLDFGFVPCKELQRRPLTIRNAGDIKVGVNWKLEPPFSISPLTSNLAPGQAATFEVSFQPQEAGSFQGHAACMLDNGVSSLCLVTGIAKFPYLSMEQPTVDFGDVLVGKVSERIVKFANHASVEANFTVEHDNEAASDGVFKIMPIRGRLGPEEWSEMRITYTPKHTGTFSCENFTLSTAGGNRVPINLRGTARGPSVTFSARTFNFGNVAAGTVATRVLYMQNHSDIPVAYDFQIDPYDTFTLNKPQGVIGPSTTAHVTISFQTGVSSNYWRRLVCLIRDADPIGVDLLATSFTDKARPPPLEHRHITAYMNRIDEGGAPVDYDTHTAGSIPPSPIPSQHELRPLTGFSSEGGSERPVAPGSASAALQSLPGPDAWPLLFTGQDPGKAVLVDHEVLEFGTCSRLSAAEYQAVVVTNRTSAKITAFFDVPLWKDPVDGELKPVFQVLPESVDIKAMATATFRVAFRPPRDAVHYCQTLVLYAHIKSMRNFRLLTDAQVVPPWSLPVVATGNTFLHVNPEFSPKVDISTRVVAFPACRPGEEACQTLVLSNYGDTPASFAFQNAKALGPEFAVKPAHGVLAARSHALVGLRFRPSSNQHYSAKAVIIFNGATMYPTEIELNGSGSQPQLMFDLGAGAGMGAATRSGTSNTLFFRPTCVGASSQRTLTVLNPSRVSVMFKWQMPSKLEGVVAVAPVSGLLRGNESTQVTWSFAPTKQKTYDARVPCLLLNPSGSSPLLLPQILLSEDDMDLGIEEVVDQVALKVVGEGTAGAMAIEPAAIDFGPLKVGHPVKHTVNLVNQSDGVLRYSLECAAGIVAVGTGGGGAAGAAEVVVEEEDGEAEPGADRVEFSSTSVVAEALRPEEMWVDEPTGALAARASKQVTLTLFPRFRKSYVLQLRCRTSAVAPVRPPSGGRSGATRLPPLAAPVPPPLLPESSTALLASAPITAVCNVRAAATFPTLRFTDVLHEASGLSKQVVWHMMGLPEMNAELTKCVTPLELELLRMEDKGTMTTVTACRALHPFNLDFGCHGVGSGHVIVRLEFTNITTLPAKWELHSFDDPDLEQENWVEPGRPRNEEEKARDFIREHSIFAMTPRRGELAPQERALITITYNPEYIGFHDYPMFLRVVDGKQLRLQLQGRTVAPPVQRLLMSPSTRVFTLDPTPIGERAPPTQLYLLRNGGPGVVEYEVDLTAVHKLAADNFGHEIVKLCCDPSGVIDPEGVAPLTWKFSPLEAKVYQVDVPVVLGDGSAEVITLLGRGYHPDRPDYPPALPTEGERNWDRWVGFSSEPSSRLASMRLALPSHDTVALGTTLPQGVVRRVLLLTNTSQYPLMFSWDLGVLGRAESLAGGKMEVAPGTGRLEPGERVLVRFVFTAGLEAALFEGEVKCRVEVDEEAVMAVLAEAQDAAYQAALAAATEYTETGSVVDEVIAEHPPRHAPFRGLRLKSRLPVHLYMTTAIAARLEKLGEQWTQTLSTLRQQEEDADAPPELPDPQTICVTINGRVLTPAQIKAGLYTPPHELEDAKAVLAGNVWVPPTVQPFYDDPSLQSDPLLQPGAAEKALSSKPKGSGAGVQGEAEGAARGSVGGGAGGEGGQAEGSISPEEGCAPDLADGEREEVPSHLNQVQEGGEEHVPRGNTPAMPTSGHRGEGKLEVLSVVVPVNESMDITFSAGIAGAPLGEVGSSVLEPVAEEGPEGEGEGAQHAAEGDAGRTSELVGDGSPQQGGGMSLSASDNHPSFRFGGGGGLSEDSGGWQPLPRVEPPPVKPPPKPTKLQQAHAAASALLQRVLREVMDPEVDPEVMDALACLQKQELPAYVQLAEAGVPELVVVGGEAPIFGAPQLPPAPTAASDRGWTAAQQPFEAEREGYEEAEGGQMGEFEGGAGQQGAALGGVEGVLKDPRFQEFAEYVLDSALFGLMCESAAGEWTAPASRPAPTQ